MPDRTGFADASSRRRILEVGTGNGEGTLLLARSLGDTGLLITIEPDPSIAADARRRFSEAGLGDRLTVIVGEPARYLHKIRGPFDLIVMRHRDDAVRAKLEAMLAAGGRLIDGDKEDDQEI